MWEGGISFIINPKEKNEKYSYHSSYYKNSVEPPSLLHLPREGLRLTRTSDPLKSTIQVTGPVTKEVYYYTPKVTHIKFLMG